MFVVFNDSWYPQSLDLSLDIDLHTRELLNSAWVISVSYDSTDSVS